MDECSCGWTAAINIPLCVCVCVCKCVYVYMFLRGHSSPLQFVHVVHVFVRSTCMCPAVLLCALYNIYNTHTHKCTFSLSLAILALPLVPIQ